LVGIQNLKKMYNITLPNWGERPQILANLTNPAFCGKVIHAFIKGYNVGGTHLPFALSFFILPLILHQKTRELIPSQPKKTLHTWLEENPQIKIELVKRIKNFNPFTRESLIFLLVHNAIEISNDGFITCQKLSDTFPIENDADETLTCFKKAEVFGKIFSKSGSLPTIYSLIGVKP